MAALSKKVIVTGGLLLTAAAVVSCANNPPENIRNSCDIFNEKSGWYADAHDSYEKWGVPVHVQLAIIYQESRFETICFLSSSDIQYYRKRIT